MRDLETGKDLVLFPVAPDGAAGSDVDRARPEAGVKSSRDTRSRESLGIYKATAK